jgi:hypothetical protein
MATYAFTTTDRSGGSAQVVSSRTFEPHGRYRMCRPTAWVVTWPTTGPDAVSGVSTMDTMLQVHRDSSLVFNGICRHLRVKGERENAKVVATFLDPMIWWYFRMLRDSTGNYAKPTFSNPITVGELLFEAITNAIAYDGGGGYGMGISLGSDATTKNVYSALGNFPLRIGEVAGLLAATGMGEWMISPVASGTTYGILNIEERMGSNKSGSVNFHYGEGGNCEAAEYDENAEQVVTKLRYLLGQKIDQEHWQASVDGGLFMEDPPQSAISAAQAAALAAWGYWFDIRYFEDADVYEGESPTTTERVLYRRMHQLEASLRVRAKRMASVTPIPAGAKPIAGPAPWDDFFIGDAVGINLDGLGTVGDVAGEQRVYGFDVKPEDQTGAERVSAVITSADGEEVV